MRLTSHYPKEVRPVHAVVRLRLTSSLTEQTFLWNVGALRRPRKKLYIFYQVKENKFNSPLDIPESMLDSEIVQYYGIFPFAEFWEDVSHLLIDEYKLAHDIVHQQIWRYRETIGDIGIMEALCHFGPEKFAKGINEKLIRENAK